MHYYKIQPAPRTDHITDDGTELTQRPYPIVCDGAGNVEGMPTVARVVGFVRDLARQQVDVSWHEVAAVHVPLTDMVGAYVVIQDHEGGWSTLVTAVESIVKLPGVGVRITREQLEEAALLDFKVTPGASHAAAVERNGGPLSPGQERLAAYRLGVHGSHCCLLHGCKYGDADCPVQAREVGQEYPCEQCPEEPADDASADELLHHLRECVVALEGPMVALNGAMPGLARALAAMRKTMDELDRQMTYGRPLPGDWNARR